MTASRCNRLYSILTRFILLWSILNSTVWVPEQAVSAESSSSLDGWLFNTIDLPADTSYAPTLAVDSSGRPHVAFIASMNLNLVYRVFDGSAWQEQWSSPGSARYINLALDSSDLPHITYMRSGVGGDILYYTYGSGQDWITEPLTTAASAGHYNSLALDEAGRPHVAYFDQDTGALMYAHFDGSDWRYTTAKAAATKQLYSHISLALNSSDQPSIAFCAGAPLGTCNLLYYSKFDGNKWVHEVVETGMGGYSASLALDATDLPHISYFRISSDGRNPSLTYRYHTGATWQTQTVVSGVTGIYNCLRLDASGHPHIAFYDQTGQDLEYAHHDGAAWQLLTLDSDSNTGLYPAIDLDPTGKPHIAYVSATENAVRYAGQPPLPDLVVSDVWASDDGLLRASVQNAGLAPVQGWLQVGVSIDSSSGPIFSGSVNLSPGDATVLSGEYACSGAQDEINACAFIDALAESDGSNNCHAVTIACDSLPPAITVGPVAGSMTQTSAIITWTTSENSTSQVHFGRSANNLQAVVNNTFVSQHSITLTGLTANASYAYLVRSADQQGNMVQSKLAYFRTLPPPGSPPPPQNFEAERKGSDSEIYRLALRFTDTSKIQKVTFTIDGKPVGSDFSPVNGLFEADLNPAVLFPDRSQFYRANDPHTIQAQVLSTSGSVTNYSYAFSPGAALRMMTGYFITPEENSILYIPGATAPSRVIGVNIYASQMEWQCQWEPGGDQNCSEMEKDVAKVEFYMGGLLKGTATTTTRTHTYHFDWDIQGLVTGPHNPYAKIFDTDGNSKIVATHINIETGQPSLTLERQVTRDGNHFDVALTIKNTSPAGLPVVINAIYDSLAGFQAVHSDSGELDRSGLTWKDGIYTRVDLNANVTLHPNQTLVADYEMVPILYPNPAAVPARIGVTNVIGASPTWVEYTVSGMERTANFSMETLQVQDAAAPGGWSSIPEAVSRAMSGSDYLIISSPQKMYDLYWDMWGISSLMGDLAHLTALKNGVLAYWPPAESKNILNSLLEDNSTWTNRLHPNFEKRGQGYVLLVGESDVIPSFTTGPYEVNWPGGDDSQMVHYTDNPYAHTDGNGAPDLLLGRIVGGNTDALDKAVRTSIRAHLGELNNDMSHVYLGSGTGNNEDGMQDDADTMEQYFATAGMTATKQHFETSGWLRRWDFAFMEMDGFTAGDPDGNGNDEIILASRDADAVYILDPANGSMISSFQLDFERGDGLTTGDVNGDGKDEILHADRADKLRIFTIQNGQWVMSSIFSLDFDAGDTLATGRILQGHAEDQIVVADYGQNTLSVYDQTGSLLLPAIDLDPLGYEFGLYDQLAIGNVGVSAIGADEIVVTDYSHDKIIILGANGVVIKEMLVTLEMGDMLAVGDVTNDFLDEIILNDTGDWVRIYRGRSPDVPEESYTLLRSIYKDIEPFDGLVVREVAGQSNDEIFHADRSHDRIIALDPYYPAANRQAFRQAAANQDLIWVFAHGSSSSMGPSIDTSTFGVNFNGSAPIVTAFSCETGNYEDGGSNSLVVNFFNSGAGGYYGSTEVSPHDKNSNMSRKLFSEFWNAGEPLVKSILEYKNNRWDVTSFYDWWYLLVNEYNYYGDPKFQSIPSSVSLTGSSKSETTNVEPVTSIVQDLPEVTITSVDGTDYVEIAGGDEYLEKDQPVVPTYTITHEIPFGYTVQDVKLVARSNRSEFGNLSLPLASAEPSSQSGLGEAGDKDPIPAWTPALEQPFTWAVNNQIGGSSTLILTIYPFTYNAQARYAEYYRHFEFQVTSLPTATYIWTAEMSKPEYRLGEELALNVAVENNGAAEDRLVNASIYTAGGELVAGFPLAYLAGLSGKGTVDLAVSSGGLNAGEYWARVEVLGENGSLYDQRDVFFHIGITSGEVTSLLPTSTSFKPGQQVNINGQANNTGDQPLNAQLVLSVSSLDGSYHVSETRSLSAIPAGSSQPFAFTWNSTGVANRDYRFTAYLIYDSQTSLVAQAEINAWKTIYLPLLRR